MEPRVSNGAGETGSREAPFIKGGYRREYKEWFKAQVVEECHKPGSSVSIVARRHDLNANLVFRWRREYRLGIIRPSAPAEVDNAADQTANARHDPGGFQAIERFENRGRPA